MLNYWWDFAVTVLKEKADTRQKKKPSSSYKKDVEDNATNVLVKVYEKYPCVNCRHHNFMVVEGCHWPELFSLMLACAVLKMM